MIAIKGGDDVFIAFQREQEINLGAHTVCNAPYRTCVILMNSHLISIQGGTLKSSEVRRSFEKRVVDIVSNSDGYHYRSKGMKDHSTRFICNQHAEPKSLVQNAPDSVGRKRKSETNRMMVCHGAIIVRYDFDRTITITSKHDIPHEVATSLVPLDTGTKDIIKERINQGFLPFQIKEALRQTNSVTVTYS